MLSCRCTALEIVRRRRTCDEKADLHCISLYIVPHIAMHCSNTDGDPGEPSHGKKPEEIYVLHRITYRGISASGTNSSRNVYVANRGCCEGYTDTWIERTFRAEFSSILLRNYPQYLDREAWMQANIAYLNPLAADNTNCYTPISTDGGVTYSSNRSQPKTKTWPFAWSATR